MKKNFTKMVALLLIMGGILIGGMSTIAKAIDPPDVEPFVIKPNPPVYYMMEE